MGGLARTGLCSLRSTKWVTHMPPQWMPIGNATAQRPRPRQFQDAQEALLSETLAGWHQLETPGCRHTSANIHTSSRNALSSMILAQDVGRPIPRDVAPARGGPRRLSGGYGESAASPAIAHIRARDNHRGDPRRIYASTGETPYDGRHAHMVGCRIIALGAHLLRGRKASGRTWVCPA
jgi:hypothetical protein